MIRSKFAKAFILGMCITIFSTSAILAADTGGGQSATAEGQQTGILTKVDEGQQGGIMITDAGSPDSTVSSPPLGKPAMNEDSIQKQSEIDKYLFEQHEDEIAEKGITITHTAPLVKYVEIGITPYNEANAEFLYKTFGKDMVKVVDGQKVILMTGAANDPDGSVSSPVMDITSSDDIAVANPELDNKILSAQDDKAELYRTTSVAGDSRVTSGMSLPLLIILVIAGAVIVLGGTVFVIHRRKVAVK